MRLYNGLVGLFRLACRLYFVDVHATARERVPARGPVLLAANHPGSILDSILLATEVPRPIHYLARSGLFRWPVAGLLRRLGAIPVHRRGEGGDPAERNRAAFAQVHQLMDAGGCVGIFPEGRNSPAGQVGPLRTGAARLALEAEARHSGSLGLTLVPVGITFENRDFLMSAVMLRFGAPIRIDAYAERYRQDPEATVYRLTDDLQQALRRETLHSEDRQLGELASALAALATPHGTADGPATAPGPAREMRRPWFKRWLWAALRAYQRGSEDSRRALEHRLRGRQRISRILARAAGAEPAAVAALRKQVERHRDHMHQTRIRYALSTDPGQSLHARWPRLRMTAYAIAAAPLALFGFVHNAIPYLLTYRAGRFFSDEPVRAFAWFGIGMLAFIATYAGLGFWLWQGTAFTGAAALAYVALLPPTGIVALGYRRALLVHRERILVRTFLWNRRELLELLEHERAVILARLDALSRRYPD